MKKFLSIIIAVQVASSAITEGGIGLELLRSINLFHHFLEHQSENEALTFGEFLYAHYLTEHHEQTDEPIDHDLPFQSSVHLHVSLGYFITSATIAFHPIDIETAKTNPSTGNEYSPSGLFNLDVWMPPRA